LELAMTDRKFLIFAHHKEMLNAIQEGLAAKRITFIRIDGSTPSTTRHTLVSQFQSSHNPQVALLSLTAAGTGLTFNKASLVVFAELYWTPGMLRQAEDRVHRIGQTETCEIRYLVGKNTLDEKIWPMVCHKLEVVGETLDGQEESLNATKVDYLGTTVIIDCDDESDPISAFGNEEEEEELLNTIFDMDETGDQMKCEADEDESIGTGVKRKKNRMIVEDGDSDGDGDTLENSTTTTKGKEKQNDKSSQQENGHHRKASRQPSVQVKVVEKPKANTLLSYFSKSKDNNGVGKEEMNGIVSDEQYAKLLQARFNEEDGR